MSNSSCAFLTLAISDRNVLSRPILTFTVAPFRVSHNHLRDISLLSYRVLAHLILPVREQAGTTYNASSRSYDRVVDNLPRVAAGIVGLPVFGSCAHLVDACSKPSQFHLLTQTQYALHQEKRPQI